MAHSHVPKFGNWDADNVPYTAYFQSARKEKSGIMMNPNDPEENPEAFNLCTRDGENIDADAVKASPRTHSHNEEGASHARHHSHRRSRGSQGSITAESAIERSNSDHPVIHRHVKPDHKRSMSKGGSIIGSFSSSSHSRHRSGSHSSSDHANHKATPIPEFGAWDVKDPKSGEGYTAIFDKIKEEKQIASASGHFPSNTRSLNNYSTIPHSTEPASRLSKFCCCLFSSES